MTQQKIELAEKLAEAFARSARKEPPPVVEDLNMLPLPTTQVIDFDNWIQWTWEVSSEMKVLVTLYLSGYEQAHRAGDFDIELIFSRETEMISMEPEEAKTLGQAIVSASNWHNIWKQHVGVFIERNIGVWTGS